MPGQQSLLKQRTHLFTWAALLTLFGALFYQPIFRTIGLGFHHGFITDLFSSDNFRVTWFTIWQALLSTGLVLVIATPIAYSLYKIRFKGQSLITVLITLPFLLPTIVVGIGFTSLLQHSSAITLIITANVFMNFGLAARIIGVTWQSIGNDETDAAALDGAGKLKTFFQVTAVQLRGAYAAAGFLVFLYCAANFGIILVLGNEKTKSLETSIYINAVENLDLTRVATLVLIQSLLTLSLFLAVSKFSRTSFAPIGYWGKNQAKNYEVRDLPALIFTLLVTAGFVITPLFSIVWRAFHFDGHATWSNFSRLRSSGARDVLSISLNHALMNSVRNAVISLVISLGIGLLIAFLLLHTRFQHLGLIFQLPLGISPVVLGLGFLITFTDGIFPLRSSWLVTPIAQSLVLIPLVLQIVLPALRGIDRELKDSAEMDGSDASTYWWMIQVPLVRKAILLATIYVVVVSMGEFGAANFLAYGDQATLPTVLYQLISHPGAINYGMALAASTILIIFAGVVLSLSLL